MKSSSQEIEQAIINSGFKHPEDILHTFIGGSELHGAKVKDTDDLDIYGLYIEKPQTMLGLDATKPSKHFHVWSSATNERRNGSDDVDIALYGLNKWAGMVAKGNPTALNFLFAPSVTSANGWTQANYEWERLREMVRGAVVSKYASHEFKGFAAAQMGRLLGTKGAGKHGQRPELTNNFGYDVKAGMHVLRLLDEAIELMLTGHMTFPRPNRELLIEVRTGGWSLDRLTNEANRRFAELDEVVKQSTLPDEADIPALNQIVTEAYHRHWTRTAAVV